MSAYKQRVILRWFHLITGAILVTYIYSPWSNILAFSFLVKFIIIPILIISGIWLWKGAQIKRLFKK